MKCGIIGLFLDKGTQFAFTILCVCVCVCLVAQLCPTLCDPMDVAHQVPLSMGFSRQEFWSELPFPPPEDLPNPGIEPTSPVSPALVIRFFTTSTTWKAHKM